MLGYHQSYAAHLSPLLLLGETSPAWARSRAEACDLAPWGQRRAAEWARVPS